MRMKRSIAATMALVALILGTIASATPLPHRGIFLYSTLCVGEEDEYGVQVVLMLMASDLNIATLVYTEGAIMEPLIASGPNVKFNEQTGEVTLRFPLIHSPTGKPETKVFTGSATDELLSVRDEYGQDLKLPRVRQAREKIPHCSEAST
jgi:hypothetical protein